MNLTRNYQEGYVMARIMRHAKRHQKNFSLARFKTWEAAEKEAEKWVKAQLKVLPPSEQNARDRMTRSNHSGVVGVYLGKNTIRKKDGREFEYWRWCAKWPGCPHKGGLSWSILRFGDKDAFVLAVLSRRMEIISRSRIEEELERIRETEPYREILKLKQQTVDFPAS